MNRQQFVAGKLEALGGNAVVYSEKAWAAARKATSGGAWFPDRGSHRGESLTSAEMSAWVKDWVVLRRGDDR